MNDMSDDLSIPQIPQIKVDSASQPNVGGGKQKKIVLGVIIGLALLLLLMVIPGLIVYQKSMKLKSAVGVLVAAVKSQNLPEISKEIGNTKNSLKSLKSSYKLISWIKFIPFLGVYANDLGHALNAGEYGLEAGEVVLLAVGPYADILGFNGQKEEAGDGTKTAQERIDFIVKSIPSLIPRIDEITLKISKIKTELDEINPEQYPVRVGKNEVRVKVKRGLELFDEGATFVTNGKPLLEAAPYLLGIDEERQYLLLFQNDKELRPTGGFLTAYSIMKVNQAKFTPVSSNDIYNLDAKYKPFLPAPDPIVKYLKGPYVLSKKLRLRDMNWVPDFEESMKIFIEEADKVGLEKVDGVISVDTQVLVNLLDALGRIGVPGFGNFSTEIEPKCNCPQVIYELESFADTEGPVVWDPAGTGKIIYAPANYDNRKKIIGPLMNSILANALGQPKDKLPRLFEAAFKSLTEKHVLFYLFDQKTQEAVKSFGIAGTLKDFNGDYLHINDANLGGRKSNLYVTQEVEQDFSIAKDGSIEKALTITYKNPEKYDGWLNSVLPNWLRVYVPKGSELISFEGVEDKADPYDEFDKTVFAGFFQLRPEGVAKVTLKYKLPFGKSDDLKLLIQKQPGTDSPLYRMTIGKNEEEFFLKTDKEIKIRM